MQGVILLGIQRFVRDRFGADFWRAVESEVNIVGRLYLPSQSYPMSEVDAVISSVSRHSGMTVPLVLESIGDYVAPDMFGAYANLLEPQWDMLDILLHSEAIVERAALKHGIKMANSPLQARAGSNGDVILAYQSPWRICQLVKGIVRGLGAHMDQPVSIDEIRCSAMGSPTCEWSVRVERIRPTRSRMASVPGGVGIVKSNAFDRVDRPSSLPPSPRGDMKSSPGHHQPYPHERHTPLPPEPSYSTSRTTNIPPASDSGAGGAGSPFGNRRR
ncbi:MAG TPA: heme NO-binding domain-containing protein [Polyangium sp.]|nr:heme NO-binding domain-containing protein [Polyangium sp.]